MIAKDALIEDLKSDSSTKLLAGSILGLGTGLIGPNLWINCWRQIPLSRLALGMFILAQHCNRIVDADHDLQVF